MHAPNVLVVLVKFAWNMVVIFCCSLVLTSCVAAPDNETQVHHLAVLPDEELPVSVQLPVDWKIQMDTTKKVLSLLGNNTGEQASITAKKLEVEEVSLKLLKAFGRIDIKEQINNGWLEQGYIDDTKLDGNPAIKYTLRKGSDAAIVYFIGNEKFVYIITINAPTENIAAINDELIQKIKFVKQNDMGGKSPPLVQKQPYIASPEILNLEVSRFDTAQDTYEKDLSKSQNLNERISLLEQVCVKYTLFKSESLFYSKNDKRVKRILNEIEQLVSENKGVRGLARCEALLSYLNNNFTQATAKLESVLQEDPSDIHAKLYLAIIRPYDTAFIGKALKEALGQQPNSILAKYMQSKYLLAEGRKRESIDMLKETLKKYPENMWLTFAVARNYQQEENLVKARELYTKVLQMDSPFIPAHYNLALILYKEKNNVEAQKHLEAFLAIHHDDPEAVLLLGLVFKNLENSPAEKQAFETVLTIEPNNYRALYNMGALCATKLNDKSCARQAFTRYMEIAPQDNRNASIMSWLSKN
jgi:tetratricopeptide (TPR) repeat protein